METLYDEPAAKNYVPGLQPGRYSVSCSRCGASYDVSRDTARRPQRYERLCVRCRGRKGIERANETSTFTTPDSSKAERIRANGLVNSRKKRGAFKAPERCMKCNRIPSRMDSHHPDYAKPDEVVFLCRSCHMKAHRDAAFLDGLTTVRLPASPHPAPAVEVGR